MRKLNPDHITAVLNKINTSPYFKLLSMKIISLDFGRALLEANIEEKHLQPYGHVHGGVYSSVIDAAGFWALYCEMDEGTGITTVEMKLNYLAPASSGRFVVEGKSIKVGKTLCLGEATVENEAGKLLAHGTVTVMVVDRVQILGRSQFPPKFID